jgi:hypothetical protein
MYRRCERLVINSQCTLNWNVPNKTRHDTFLTFTERSWKPDSQSHDKNADPLAGLQKLWRSSCTTGPELTKGCARWSCFHHCIGRESNPGLAESSEMISLMATANFTTKPPMLDGRRRISTFMFSRKCADHFRKEQPALLNRGIHQSIQQVLVYTKYQHHQCCGWRVVRSLCFATLQGAVGEHIC